MVSLREQPLDLRWVHRLREVPVEPGLDGDGTTYATSTAWPGIATEKPTYTSNRIALGRTFRTQAITDVALRLAAAPYQNAAMFACPARSRASPRPARRWPCPRHRKSSRSPFRR